MEQVTEELEVYEPSIAPANLFGASNPAEVVARSIEAADALVDVINAKKLWVNISGRSHVLVDGWTLLGSMCGVFPVVVWTHKLTDPDGWEARVEARTLAGAIVGAAEAECLRSEKQWGGRDDYALRSMAQTRATSKALRGPLGFIVHLAGFSATPAEEMPSEAVIPASTTPPARKITDPQMKKIGACIRELDRGGPPEGYGDWTAATKAWMNGRFKKTSRKDLTAAEAGEVIDMLEQEIKKLPV